MLSHVQVNAAFTKSHFGGRTGAAAQTPLSSVPVSAIGVLRCPRKVCHHQLLFPDGKKGAAGDSTQ